MKKIVSILLSLFILWAYLPCAEAAEGENIIRNPSFEQNNGWFESSKSAGGMTTAQKRTGNRSGWLTSEGSQAWLAQMYVPVYPNTDYALSAYFLQKTAIESGVRFKVEFYCDRDCTEPKGAGLYSPYMESFDDGNWHAFSYDFKVPAEIYGLLIYVRLDKAGTVYVDDMSLFPTSQIPAFFLSTDNEIYYSEWGGNVTATAKMHTEAYPALAGGTTKFQLKDGSEVLDERIYPFSETITYTVAQSKLTKEKAPYTVEATAYDKNGSMIYSTSSVVYRFNRPTMIDNTGNILVNGKPFVPVFFYYNTYTKEGIEREKSMGANTILIENWMVPDPDLVEDTLDLCRDNGVKAILRLYYKMLPAGHANNAQLVENLLKRISGHPAVLGYILMDEPGGVLKYGYEKDLLNSYLLVRKFDNAHPTIINEQPQTAFETAARYCDILSHDPYPGISASGTNTYTSHVAEGIQKAVAATKGKKPVFAVLQAFDYQFFSPNAAQLRQMFYQALAAGAKGFGYYSQKAVWNTKLKEGLVSFASTEQTAVLAAVNNNTLIKEDTASYAIRMWQSGQDTYVLLLNLQKDADSALQMHFWGNKVPTAYAIGDASGLTYRYSGDTRTFSVGKGGAVLLKLPEGEAAAHLFSDAFHVHLEDKDGNILSQIHGDENFTAVLRMGNAENSEKSFFGTAALYAKTEGKQKELIKTVPFSPVVPAMTGVKPGEYSLDIPFDMNGQGTKPEYFIKVLLWTNRGRMIPAEISGTGVEIG